MLGFCKGNNWVSVGNCDLFKSIFQVPPKSLCPNAKAGIAHSLSFREKVYLFLGYGWLAGQLNSSLHSPALARMVSVGDQPSDWLFNYGLIQFCLWAGEPSLLGIHIARFDRGRLEQQRLSAEMDAARTAHQVLVPERVPAIRGLAISCVYKPAGEVGGDFFQGRVHSAWRRSDCDRRRQRERQARRNGRLVARWNHFALWHITRKAPRKS